MLRQLISGLEEGFLGVMLGGAVSVLEELSTARGAKSFRDLLHWMHELASGGLVVPHIHFQDS
jgi:gamma-glutamyltranspeptidase